MAMYLCVYMQRCVYMQKHAIKCSMGFLNFNYLF